MAGVLTKATLADLDRLEKFVSDFHAEEGLNTSQQHRLQALRPLLRGSPLGEAFLIGSQNAPIGYVVISHGYSIEYGGPDAIIDELYLRPRVRGRGIGGDVLDQIAEYLISIGTKAVHLEVDHTNEIARGLYKKRKFSLRSNYGLMTRVLF